ncbi:ORF2 [Marmot associated torque teno virus]|nr:ORF2 [Marmot associated torque teno virus]
MGKTFKEQYCTTSMPRELAQFDYTRCEEAWLASVVTSHLCWCDCGDWRQHVPGWRGIMDVPTGGDEDTGDGGGDGDEVTDAELIGAASAVEGTEDVRYCISRRCSLAIAFAVLFAAGGLCLLVVFTLLYPLMTTKKKMIASSLQWHSGNKPAGGTPALPGTSF